MNTTGKDKEAELSDRGKNSSDGKDKEAELLAEVKAARKSADNAAADVRESKERLNSARQKLDQLKEQEAAEVEVKLWEQRERQLEADLKDAKEHLKRMDKALERAQIALDKHQDLRQSPDDLADRLAVTVETKLRDQEEKTLKLSNLSSANWNRNSAMRLVSRLDTTLGHDWLAEWKKKMEGEGIDTTGVVPVSPYQWKNRGSKDDGSRIYDENSELSGICEWIKAQKLVCSQQELRDVHTDHVLLSCEQLCLSGGSDIAVLNNKRAEVCDGFLEGLFEVKTPPALDSKYKESTLQGIAECLLATYKTQRVIPVVVTDGCRFIFIYFDGTMEAGMVKVRVVHFNKSGKDKDISYITQFLHMQFLYYHIHRTPLVGFCKLFHSGNEKSDVADLKDVEELFTDEEKGTIWRKWAYDVAGGKEVSMPSVDLPKTPPKGLVEEHSLELQNVELLNEEGTGLESKSQ